MKSLFLGILFIIIVGIGGLVYRNAIEHKGQPIACPFDVEICPDSTSVARTGPSCTFPVCPPPNVSLADAKIAYAIPDGFTPAILPDGASIADYVAASSSSTITPAEIIVRSYAIDASSTALTTIQQTAIGGASGAPVNPSSFVSQTFGTNHFTVVRIERFEGVIRTAYYLSRTNDVLRFEAIDRDAPNWMENNLDVTTLPAHAALLKLLGTLQIN